MDRKLTQELKYPDELKYRNEMKYQCSEQELCLIENQIRHLCRPDPHAGDNGRYTVRSVYFDDYQDSCYYENEAGVNLREKYRIRIYNGSSDNITLECKRKQNGKNLKQGCRLNEEQCRAILEGSFRPDADSPPLLHQFFLLYRTRLYRAKVIVEYERTPYIYEPGNVRITFDRNISATSKVQDFLQSRVFTRPVMPVNMHLLEVKYDELIPNFLYNELQIDNLHQAAYSKYYVCRRFTKDYFL